VNQEITDFLEKVVERYDLPGDIISATQCLNGHINGTYHVTLLKTDGEEDNLIVQKINHYVFKVVSRILCKRIPIFF